ncbi:MAG TPA: S8 family serine peptidase [Pyrinomonadaceae bacterium]|nr:S8 family serine peptidase [Pyrinomonadaceae bacterium]
MVAVDDDPDSSLDSSYIPDAKMAPDEESYFNAKATPTGGVADNRYAVALAGTKSYRVFNIEFDSARACNSFKVRGAYVFNRFRRFADVFIADDGTLPQVHSRVRKAPGVVWIEMAGRATAPPQPRALTGFKTKQPPEAIVRGGFQGLTGAGVIIAFVDSGLDFRNPDFVKYDQDGQPTSRLRYFWDTTSDAFDTLKLGTKPPLSYPNGASVGTLYTREQLTAELRSTTRNIPATDLCGHGTACAGVAAGNGNNAPGNKYVQGVAPEADIIAVRVGAGEGGEMENSYLLNAVAAWLDTVSADVPLVVSCSFGSLDGGHDGHRVAERQLDARFALNRRGRALVVAAGNEGTAPVHAEVNFKGWDGAGLLHFTATASDAHLYVYFDSDDVKDILASTGKGMKKKVWVNPLTKQAVMLVTLPNGDGKLRLSTLSGRSMKADAYIFKGSFKPGSVSYSNLISSPGTAGNAITVGSYDWNDVFGEATWNDACNNLMVVGRLSCYSSPGYTRLGTIKPDFAAPGQYYSASYARKPDGSGVNPMKIKVDATSRYRLFSGTSAATPYTSGVVALLLQKKPTLTVGEIKDLLRLHSTSSQRLTGDVPNPQWGYGKLDLAAVERIMKAVD